MKARFFILFLVFTISITKAQKPTISSSSEMNNTYPQNFWTQNLGMDESGYYLIRDIGPGTDPEIILEKYDKNFNLLFSKDIESSSGVFGDSKNHFKTLLGNGELLVFLSSWNKDRKEGGLWVQRLSTSGELLGEEIELINEQNRTLLKSSDYQMSLSSDGKKLAVLTEPTFSKNELESFGLSVFNTVDFVKIAEKDFIFDTEMKRWPRNQVFVNNRGVAFGFKEVKVSGKEFKYFLASVGEGSKYQQELDFQDMQLNQSKFIISNNGELVGAGLTAEAKKFSTLWQSTWYLKANNKEVLKNNTEPLETSLLSQFMSEKSAAREGAALNYFVIKDLLEKPNGGYLLLTEQLNQGKTALPSHGTQPPAYIYKFTYGGIILLSFIEDGKLDWSTFYDKKQQFQTEDPKMEMGSFAYGLIDNKLQMIWNLTELYSNVSFPKRHWMDKSGNRIAVIDVFGSEASYPTFLTSVNLDDGTLNYAERTFTAYPLNDIQRENNFTMAVDPSIFFSSPKGITVLSRMPGVFPKKLKFSTVSFE